MPAAHTNTAPARSLAGDLAHKLGTPTATLRVYARVLERVLPSEDGALLGG